MPSVPPHADQATVTFEVADPDHRLAGVRLYQEARVPGDRLDFAYAGSAWRLTLDRPPLCRMEYLFELSHRDGGRELVPDPGNPRRAPGAFGEKSVIEFPGYAPPAWLAGPFGGETRPLEVPAPTLGDPVPVRLWSPPGADRTEALPLLVVQDGPEYDALAGLTHYLGAGIGEGWLPRLRTALLRPSHRDDWYSANPAYATALHDHVLPALADAVPVTTRVGMGTSLGALATLHAHRLYPDVFDALFLQSGSFFQDRFDAHEGRFRHYRRVVAFVSRVLAGTPQGRPVPTALTCGAIEENVHNNRLMARALRDQGYQVTLHETPDVHNFTGWRDAFDPHLTRLLQRVRT